MSYENHVKRLDEVCENLDRLREPISKKNRDEGPYPYYGASGIVDHVADYIFDEDLLLVSEDGANLLDRNYPIAFSISGKNWVNNHAHVLRFDDKISQRFVEYYLNSIKLDPWVSGMAQPKLNQRNLNSIPVPFPQLLEQKRIVVILDEAFEAIDQAKDNIERNIENVEELFQSKLDEIFNKEIKEWNKKKLEDVCEDIFAGGDTPKENFSKAATEDLKVPVIGNAVKNGGLHGFTNEPRVTEPSITIAARGSGTGHAEVRVEPYLPVVRLIVLIPDNDKIRLSFLKYVIDNLEILRSGSAIPQLTVPMIKSYSFHIPELKVQKKIEADLDMLRQNVDEIIEIYESKIEALDELKKSILQKAFSGELTANEQVAV